MYAPGPSKVCCRRARQTGYALGMSESASPIRVPAVAGRFYPAEERQLSAEVAGYLRRGAGDNSPRPACAVMAPHAGYVYSGGVAGQVFARVDVPERVIVLCPNHTGRGARVAVVADGAFEIPGAQVPIDAELARAVLAEVPGAQADRRAHRAEHAIEVELPFLRARKPAVRIVPIVLGGLGASAAMELGRGLARAVRRVGAEPGRDVLLVASSDMSHFLPDDEARRVDRIALEPLLSSDPEGLYRTVVTNDISMCGYIPATAMLTYAHELNAQAPALVGYATSAEAFGDTSRVVGYAGVIILP